MKRVIIESPYAASAMRSVEDNVAYARRAMLYSLGQQEAPFASHLHYTTVLDDKDARERALGIEAGLAWGTVADLVAVYVDYGISRGMRHGIQVATERGTRIVYRFYAALGTTGLEEFAESLMLPSRYNHEVF